MTSATTIEEVLRSLVSDSQYIDGEIYESDFGPKLNETLSTIEQLVLERVIGKNKQDEHKEWDCPCGRTHSFTQEWHATNNLRDEQRQALTQLLRGDKQ